MITPEEIKQQVLKWWKPVLQHHIAGEPFFPKSLDRIGKIQPGHITHRFEALQQEIESLYGSSKSATGNGYTVITAERNFRRTGNHVVPDAIVFETIEDYIAFIGKKKEWKLFLSNYGLLLNQTSSLKAWAFENCLWLTDPFINWSNVLKVCRYFLNTPRPDLYIRQLPLDIHTKFIEENEALMLSLLDFLIPDHVRNAEQKKFAERYFLRCDEPLVRMRILDTVHSVAGKFSDISIPLSDFERTDWPVQHVIIAENKMNFLTIPSLPSAIAVWSGGGFNIGYLRRSSWLQGKNILYWGDIDEHGFQILHQLRGYYPHVKSMMMNRATFDRFSVYAVNGSRSKYSQLSFLSEEEAALYQHLKGLENNNRLEQEKIPQAYADEVMRLMIGG